MNYIGLELENFDKAHIWRKYIYFLIKKYFKDGILEVGAGIGSFTNNYKAKFSNISLTDVDENFTNLLKKKFLSEGNIKVIDNSKNDNKKKFNTVIYLNVLEHIKNDIEEINSALEKLNPDGKLIILVPAHNNLYGKFDEAVGHYKRYEMSFFQNNKFRNSELIDLYYLDGTGYFLYYINQFFFKDEVYPSKFKIFIWDKIFTPLTILIDFLLRYRFGKNIICILKKK